MSAINREVENVKSVAADAQEHLHQLKDDAARMAQSAVGVGRAGVEAVRDKISQGSDAARGVARDMGDRAVNKGNDLLETLQERIEENPVQAIAIAAGVGVVLGLLLRRR
jgi:ElaB/YqjD/DUF883 family membrane-anchored ribosome-binding protein